MGSYGIDEEICKWQCVYCIVIYWEWGHWLTFFVDFHICCIENDQKKSHFTIIIAIYYAPMSLDSIRRSFGVWYDNIPWLALRIRSSSVLHILGENLKTKNDNFSGSREFYDAFKDVPRPQQHIRKGCECMIWARWSSSVAIAWLVCSTKNTQQLLWSIISRQPKLQWRSQNMPRAWINIVDNYSSLWFELQWRFDFVNVGWV